MESQSETTQTVSALKLLDYPHRALKNKGIVDSGCSRHMTGKTWKYPIKEWKTKCLVTKPQVDKAKNLEEINQNVVIRSNGQKKYFSTLMRVLSIFDREDLNAVYQLVMDRYQDEIPKGFDRVLWGDLMVMFNPDDENEFWNSQQDWNIVSWKLHGSSGVHTLVTETGLVIHMLVEDKYPLKKEVLSQLIELKLETEEDSTMALEVIRFVKNNEKSSSSGNLGSGSGLDWLFDIDLLTNSMNYEPVTAGNQTNKNAEDAVTDDAGKKTNKDPAKENDKSGQGEATNTNSTNRLNTVSSLINTVTSSFTTIDPGRERVERNKFESVFGQNKDTNGNSIYRMFTPVSAAGSTCDNLGGSIPVNAASYHTTLCLESFTTSQKSRDTIMLNSDESGVTHTEISSPFKGLSDIGSPGVVGPEHEGLPWMLDDLKPDEEYDEDHEEDSVDYLADGGDDGDDEDDPSDDDEDEEVDIEADDEEEEYPAPADSTAVALPIKLTIYNHPSLCFTS
ncbi:hypothetical protein Tco_1578772 [Tanacetum coccineum]